MNHFIHDAGHELKTPIAVISGNLQVLRDIKVKDMNLILESITTLHSMSDTLNGLLEISSFKLPKVPQKISLKKVVQGELHELEKAIQEKEITLIENIHESIRVGMGEKHLSLVIANLLKNAILYNKNG